MATQAAKPRPRPLNPAERRNILSQIFPRGIPVKYLKEEAGVLTEVAEGADGAQRFDKMISNVLDGVVIVPDDDAPKVAKKIFEAIKGYLKAIAPDTYKEDPNGCSAIIAGNPIAMTEEELQGALQIKPKPKKEPPKPIPIVEPPAKREARIERETGSKKFYGMWEGRVKDMSHKKMRKFLKKRRMIVDKFSPEGIVSFRILGRRKPLLLWRYTGATKAERKADQKSRLEDRIKMDLRLDADGKIIGFGFDYSGYAKPQDVRTAAIALAQEMFRRRSWRPVRCPTGGGEYADIFYSTLIRYGIPVDKSAGIPSNMPRTRKAQQTYDEQIKKAMENRRFRTPKIDIARSLQGNEEIKHEPVGGEEQGQQQVPGPARLA